MNKVWVRLLAPFLRALSASGPELRQELERHGVSVVSANFYSPVPTIAEIRQSFEYVGSDRLPYMTGRLFDQERMLALLEELKPFADEFSPPAHGEEASGRFFWDNPMFSHSDALAYYSMVRRSHPRRIVEVGSGFSTMVANEAMQQNGSGEIVCVEPYPRAFLGALPRVARVVAQPVQTLDTQFFHDLLDDGDCLFIDSTHTVKSGSDCLYLYLRVVPFLRKRTLIHVHDVWLPEALPQDWLLVHHRYWTEQYLLLAYLLDNPKVQLLWATNYHAIVNPAALDAFMAGKAWSHGGSLWFERQP